MKNDQKYFMQQGRTEFNKQLNKWQDFFDETYDDYYEMENRLEKLETFVEIMSGNLEDLETDWQEVPIRSSTSGMPISPPQCKHRMQKQ